MSSAAAPPQVPPVQILFQAGTGYIVSSAFYVAVKLEIADLLEKGPRTAADLAKAAGVNEDALYRVLRALSAVGIFEERVMDGGEHQKATSLLASANPWPEPTPA